MYLFNTFKNLSLPCATLACPLSLNPAAKNLSMASPVTSDLATAEWTAKPTSSTQVY